MNSSLLTKTLIVIMTIVSLGQGNEVPAQNKRVVYSCIQHQGKAKTVADTNRGKIELIVWESGYFSGSGWTPQKRCQEVTRRFQQFSDNGTLQYVTTGVINNYPVICTGTRTTRGYQCRPDGLLITLQRNDNPAQVLRNLFSNATRKGGTPVTRSLDDNYVVPINSVLEQAPRLEGSTSSSNQEQPLLNETPNEELGTTKPQTNEPSLNRPPLVSSNPSTTPKTSTRNYQCIQHEGKPMTIVDTPRGRIKLILWESSYFSQSSWTPQKRCDEVTRRFQKFSDDGTLKYITTGKIGQYNVICVSGQKPSPGSNIDCSSEGLLITLEPTDNPDTVMKELFQEATKVGSMPVRRSQRILDMEQYLSKAPLMAEESVVNPTTSVNVEEAKPENNTEQPNVIDCPPILCD